MMSDLEALLEVVAAHLDAGVERTALKVAEEAAPYVDMTGREIVAALKAGKSPARMVAEMRARRI